MAGKAHPQGDPFLVFRLPGHACAVSLILVQEVVPMAELSRPPGLPPVVEGFLNLGGSAVPVLRPDRLLGLPEVAVGLYTPLIVLRQGRGSLALLVETVEVIGPATERLPLPTGAEGGYSFNDCAEGQVVVGKKNAVVLSVERLLLEKERQCLAHLQAIEQERLRRLEESRP
jgi:purine-binding chemotaxis protein CheW